MKRVIIIVVLLFAITTLKAQEKEIKKAHREVKAGNLKSAASYLSQAKRIFAAADYKTRAEYYVVEAEMRLAEKKLDAEQIELITQSLNYANKYEVTAAHQVRIAQIKSQIKGSSATIAASELKNKNYSKAATLYNAAYQSSQSKAHLLKAARCHLLAEEHSEAFKLYTDLYHMGDTDAKTQYVATNANTNKKVAFATADARDKAIAARTHMKPELITTNSKMPEILRGLTVSAIPLGKKYQAVNMINKVLAKSRGNVVLLNQSSHLYKQLEAFDRYDAVVDQLIKNNPNDPNLYYNAAVSATENKNLDRAKELYKKTLKVDPNYINAKINLSNLLLDEDSLISDAMFKLGTSETEDEQYEKLKSERIKIYNEVLPYLESIVKAQPKNQDLVKKLKNINNFLGKGSVIAIEQPIDD